MLGFRRMSAVVPVVALVLTACGSAGDPSGPAESAALAPSLASIQPGNAATGVDPSAPVVLKLSQSMQTGMEMLVVLHEDNVTGATIPASAAWSLDRMTLTLKPQSALKRGTTYVVHLSPSLQDTAGRMINMTSGTMLGGRTVSGGMMGSGSMTNGQWGPGMMGAGWQASNGTFGMIFTFTTS